MTSVLNVIEPAIMAAVTAVAFAVLFSVPTRTLHVIAGLGALGIAQRLFFFDFGLSTIEGTFVSAAIIGIISIWLSWKYHAAAIVFSIPSVIPMVPGVYAYRTMMGLLAFTHEGGINQEILLDIISNGLMTAFLFLCLAIGVSIPNLLLRGLSIRDIVKPETANVQGESVIEK